jgi:hypothetical protein
MSNKKGRLGDARTARKRTRIVTVQSSMLERAGCTMTIEAKQRAADVADDALLRLRDAVEIMFPHGGMSASALRREAKRGRLAISRIAGKDFTTIGDIRGMIEQCRDRSSRQDSAYDGNAAKTAASLTLPCGLSLMEVANSELDAALANVTARKKN